MLDPFLGKAIGKYQIVEHIGRGATADVYKAYQPTLDRHVAIKFLHTFLAQDPDFLSRFQHEARSIARLRHPNIVQVYDFDVMDGTYYLVMEFIEGSTLKARLLGLSARHELLALDEAIRIVRCVASALSYAHGRDMVHRDIKPANIMLDQENQVILTDFGLTKILGSAAQQTASGATMGTPAYASPEQVLAQPCDSRSDIYSLGVVFFQMVTGHVPYEADTGVAVFLKHITEPLPSPRQLNPALSQDIEAIVFKAMAKSPGDRYQTAEELIEDLDRVKAGLPPEAALSAPATRPDDALGPAAAVFISSPLPALKPAAPPATAIQLPTYTLSPGLVATAPADLPAVCDADWDRAVTHLVKGYITNWLREGVDRMRTAHQHGLADELELIVSRAETILQRVRGEDELDRNAALEEFLESLGAPPPVLDVAPKQLALPAIGAEEIGQSVVLTITNTGRGYLFGQVICQVPWLKVEQAWFGCAAGAHCDMSVKPDSSGVSAGRIEAADGIRIRSTGGDQAVAVQVDVLPSALTLDVSMLDFGTVGQWEIVQTTLTLRNSGRGYLTGSLQCLVPWLTASPDRFRVLAGENIQITVAADSQMLRPGSVALDRALVVDSNGGHAVLGAQMRVQSPLLKLAPAHVDWGSLDLAQPGAGPSAAVEVRNVGLGVLTGVLTSEADWLTIEPAAFRCRSGEAQQVHLLATQLKIGDHRQIVRVISNVGDAELPVQLRVLFSLEPEMVRVPAGEFLRGSEPLLKLEGGRKESGPLKLPQEMLYRALGMEGEGRVIEAPPSEQPQRLVYLSEYWIGRYPVTNAQYTAFVSATGRRPPAHWVDGACPAGQEDYPVVNVNWNDAMAYCRWLAEVTGKAYRLPTEAEWEKAARGADGRMYPWGNRWDRQMCNTLEGGARGATTVGVYSPMGDSPYGCVDMAGNVWEWVSDWYSKDYYALSTVLQNPRGPAKGVVMVMRGGSWNTDAWQARASNRYYANRNLASPEVGFRCALA